MPLSEIQAFNADWDESSKLFPIPDALPIPNNSYLVKTHKELEMRLSLDIWITFYKKTASAYDGRYLCQGTVLRVDPPVTPGDTAQTILFRLNEIMPEEAILRTFPERQYAVELDEHLRSEYDACSYMKNVLTLRKMSADSYSLAVDFYGNRTEALIQMYQEKMYIWKTEIGFDFFECYYGKYLVPEWLKQIIDDHSSNELIRYYDQP